MGDGHTKRLKAHRLLRVVCVLSYWARGMESREVLYRLSLEQVAEGRGMTTTLFNRCDSSSSSLPQRASISADIVTVSFGVVAGSQRSKLRRCRTLSNTPRSSFAIIKSR